MDNDIVNDLQAIICPTLLVPLVLIVTIQYYFDCRLLKDSHTQHILHIAGLCDSSGQWR